MEINSLGKLRSIRDDELLEMLAWRNAPAVRQNMYTRHEITVEEHLAWWRATENRSDRQYFMYEADGFAQGIVGFTGLDFKNRSSSWAFYAAPGSAKGTGSRMEFLALEHAFTNLQLHKLHCEVLAFNEAVIGLHQKFGFEIEGILREHHKVDEAFVDIYLLGILDGEWGARRAQMFDKLVRFTTA